MRKLLQFIIIFAIAILLVTNPGSDRYETYASDKLTTYLKDDLCNRLTKKASSKLVTPCQILVDTANPQLAITIKKNTKRQNFFFFSLYKTNLSLPPIISEYKFATVGILERFFTYETEQND